MNSVFSAVIKLKRSLHPFIRGHKTYFDLGSIVTFHHMTAHVNSVVSNDIKPKFRTVVSVSLV